MDENVVHRRLEQKLLVRFPNGETFALHEGPSALLIKAVLEQFAPCFLNVPAAIRVSEQGIGADVRGRDECDTIGFSPIDLQCLSPIVLADVSYDTFKLVFIETVKPSGRALGMTKERKGSLLATVLRAGLSASDAYFVTSFLSRDSSCFRKLVSELAWGSFAWFASEPDKLLAMREGCAAELSSLFVH